MDNWAIYPPKNIFNIKFKLKIHFAPLENIRSFAAMDILQHNFFKLNDHDFGTHTAQKKISSWVKKCVEKFL